MGTSIGDDRSPCQIDAKVTDGIVSATSLPANGLAARYTLIASVSDPRPASKLQEAADSALAFARA
jgi:hypothetical protein